MTFFDSEKMSCAYVEELQTLVYGMSYEHQEIKEPLYDTCMPELWNPLTATIQEITVILREAMTMAECV